MFAVKAMKNLEAVVSEFNFTGLVMYLEWAKPPEGCFSVSI